MDRRNYRRAAVGAALLSASTLAFGCVRAARGFGDTTVRGMNGTVPDAPPGEARLVVIHGVGDASNPVVFTADGTAICQVPPGTHCAASLAPGSYRLYIAWTEGVVDVWELEVAAGRTYYGTLRGPRMGWGGYVNEKLTPGSPSWANLQDYLVGQPVAIDPGRAADLAAELGDIADLVERGDSRFGRYDERHIEAHTFHPNDGV